MAGKTGSRIIIGGTFCSLNKGDAAMRIAMVDELRRAIPDCRVTVMTPFPELDRSAYSADQVLECSRRRPFRATAMVLRALIWRAARFITERDCAFVLDNELKAYREADLVIDLSGDGLTEEYGAKCILSHMVPIVIGKLLKKHVFVCAQTIGPFYKTRYVSRWALSKADIISAREQTTMDYLNTIGLVAPKLVLTADMAFLMRPAPLERARGILEAEGVRTDRPLVGLSVSKLPGHVLDKAEYQKPQELEATIASVLDQVVEMGLRPVFISHVSGPGLNRDDRTTAKRVAGLARHCDEVEVLSGEYTPEETKALIGQTELFVGMRMHSNIAALSMGVPTISIAYGPKAHGIMGQAGQDRWVVGIRDVNPESLGRLIRDAWDQREAVRESLRLSMPNVNALAEENVNIAKTMLNGRAAVP